MSAIRRRATSAAWDLAIDPATGALARLAHPADAHGMNWVCAPAENAWFPRSYGWGLGHLAMPGHPATHAVEGDIRGFWLRMGASFSI